MEKIEAIKEDIKLNNLKEVRKHLKIDDLIWNIHKKGDRWKIAQGLKINYSSLGRALDEKRILRKFPKLSRSKCAVLARLKTNKELKLFSKKYHIYKPSTRRLRKFVRKWNKDLEKDPLRLLTKLQHDLIIGSTLGDANIRQRDKNCSFRVGHSKKQEKYLRWKYHLLKVFTKSTPYWNKRNFHKNTVETLEFSTFTHYVFNFYRKLFYKKGTKTVTRKILNLLNPRSLAIWICDDGSHGKRQKYIILCTNSYTFGQHIVMKKYFKEVWDLNPTIGFRDEKYYYLRFNKEDTKKLISIIKPFVPSFMKHKIGEKDE